MMMMRMALHEKVIKCIANVNMMKNCSGLGEQKADVITRLTMASQLKARISSANIYI